MKRHNQTVSNFSKTFSKPTGDVPHEFTPFALLITALLTGSAFADDCQNLYNEAVKVERECLNYQTWLNVSIERDNKFYAYFSGISYPTAAEVNAKAVVLARLKDMKSNGTAELNVRCDKRWDVSAVLVNNCEVKTECQPNSKNGFELKIYNVEKTASHVMHTYDEQYACIGRKAKISAAAKKMSE